MDAVCRFSTGDGRDVRTLYEGLRNTESRDGFSGLDNRTGRRREGGGNVTMRAKHAMMLPTTLLVCMGGGTVQAQDTIAPSTPAQTPKTQTPGTTTPVTASPDAVEAQSTVAAAQSAADAKQDQL